MNLLTLLLAFVINYVFIKINKSTMLEYYRTLDDIYLWIMYTRYGIWLFILVIYSIYLRIKYQTRYITFKFNSNTLFRLIVITSILIQLVDIMDHLNEKNICLLY